MLYFVSVDLPPGVAAEGVRLNGAAEEQAEVVRQRKVRQKEAFR